MIIVKRSFRCLPVVAAVLALVACDGGNESSPAAAETSPVTAAVETGPAARSAPPSSGSTLTIEPAQLDLGPVYVRKTATGIIRLVNSGRDPLTIQDCKTSCRCAATDCPRGKQIQPGEFAELEVRLTAGALPRKMDKFLVFSAVGQEPVTLPVSAQVTAYVTADPMTIDPLKATDGRVVISSTDGQPFRITSMRPPVIEAFAQEASLQHEVFLDWAVWEQFERRRRLRLIFYVDHPEATEVGITVRAPKG
jgi:hypothetical protein